MKILLDAASMKGYIFQAQDINGDHRCLFEGNSKTTLGSAAPWLFDIYRSSYFAEWLSELALSNHWGIIVESEAEDEALYRHLRKFLIVEKEDGKELYFRFYDPRVFRVFLPTCDAQQIEEFFSDVVDSFIMEDESGQLVRFFALESQLKTQNLDMNLAEFLNAEKELPLLEAQENHVSRKTQQKPPWSF